MTTTTIAIPDWIPSTVHAQKARRIGNEIWFRRKEAERTFEEERARDRSIWYNSILAAAAVGILFVIVFLKAETAAASDVDGVLLFYTFFVTLFQLSRVAASTMFSSSYRTSLTAKESFRGTYQPKISFVIPAFNEEGEIQNTIRTCFAAEYPPHLIEAIVINDASTDGTREKILQLQSRYPNLIFVDLADNRGKRHGMAEGFRRATGEIVIQLDSDSRVDPRDVKMLVEPFRNPRVGAVSFHTDPANADKNVLTKMQAAYYFLSFRILKAAESTFRIVFCCSGCASAYRRDIVVPILDEWLEEKFLGLPVTWGDDRSLTNRVIKLGYDTLYSDKARAYTIVPDNVRQFLKQQIRWKKGWFVNSMFAARFMVKRDPFVAFTYFFPLMIVTVLTPFMAARAFFYTPLTHGLSSTGYYMLGVFAIAALFLIVYRYFDRQNRYYPYVFLWAVLNMLVLSYMLFIALITIQNRGWGTRGVIAKSTALPAAV
jgi:hyaluronan synthase